MSGREQWEHIHGGRGWRQTEPPIAIQVSGCGA